MKLANNNMTIFDKTTIKFLLVLNLILLSVMNFKSNFFFPKLTYNNNNNNDNDSSSSGCTITTTSNNDISQETNNNNKCFCKIPQHGTWTGQAGQDEYLFQRVFFQQSLCCIGTFIEFGARNGIEHSNTYIYEKDLGWKGLMFEVDPNELPNLQRNRPGAHILQGPVCPSYQSNVTIAISNLAGWTGPGDTMEPTRKDKTRQEINYKCYHLATELRNHNITRVDYMTIDTEGSELDIVLDFPWNEFDIHVIQIEQLVESKYTYQKGKKQQIIQHLTKNFGYKLLGIYQVGEDKFDTDDLLFTSPSMDPFLSMTDYMIGKHSRMTDTVDAADVATTTAAV